MIEKAIKRRYIIQRLVYGSFGSPADKWVSFGYERFCSRETLSALRGKPTDPAIAEAALLEVSKARPYERFRLALETTTIEHEIELGVGPRRILTPNDIAEFLKGRKVDEQGRDTGCAIAFDGFRMFNGVIPAVREIHLNPWHFGAYRLPVVKEALRQAAQGHFEDKWFPLYPCEADDHKLSHETANSFINFGLQAEIECKRDGFGAGERTSYVRSDYAGMSTPHEASYDTLAKAKAGKPVKAKSRRVA